MAGYESMRMHTLFPASASVFRLVASTSPMTSLTVELSPSTSAGNSPLSCHEPASPSSECAPQPTSDASDWIVTCTVCAGSRMGWPLKHVLLMRSAQNQTSVSAASPRWVVACLGG